MAINPKYIPFYNLNEIFLDKDSGLPLSGGVVTFWQDNQRTTLKPVYQITGTDPNYTFAELSNPLVLSSTGTFVDSLGNPIVVYGYPYEPGASPPVEERYYVTVVSAEGVSQETIPATPYIPDSGSSTTNRTNAENSLANSQFVEVYFEGNGPQAYSVTGTDTVTPLAPDWDLITTGTGTVTVTRVTSIGASSPANPVYALKIATTGITGTYKLRQRFTNTPRIYGGGYVSAYFLASVTSASAVNVIMNFTQSSGTNIVLLNETVTAGAGFLEFADTAAISATGASESDGGYVDVSLEIDVDSKISVSCIQVAGVTSATDVLAYNEQTEAEGINALYQYAYPIVPIGAVIDFAGFAAPEHYLFCDGTAYNRVTYEQLFRALTTTEDVSLTSGVNTFTVVSGAVYYIGMTIEGTGIAASTTITNIADTTITMSNNATATATSTVRFFAWGTSASDTFNVPNLTGYVTAGADGSLFGSGLNAVGYKGGASTHTIAANELPEHTHALQVGAASGVGAASRALSGAAGAGVTGVNSTTATAMTIVQPTANMRKYIRYQ